MAHAPIEEDPPKVPASISSSAQPAVTGSATGPSYGTHPLLPEQLRQARARSDEPQRRLMIAVLEDAVDCFKKNAFANSARSKALFHDAIEWFSCAEEDWPFSFERICEALDLNADNIRSGLFRWKEEELQRLQARRIREIRQLRQPDQT